MFKHTLYTQLLLLILARFSYSHRILSPNGKLTFVNSFCSHGSRCLDNSSNYFEHLLTRDQEVSENGYTFKNFSVLYLKKNKDTPSGRKSLKKTPKKTKKNAKSQGVPELVEAPEGEDSSFSAEQVYPGDVAEDEDPETELGISKRMLNSIMSLTSSLYTPDLYDIIPILYIIKEDVLDITQYAAPPLNSANTALDRSSRVNGIFMNSKDGAVESLLLSIPAPILGRLSQSKKYVPKVEASESPVQIIRLGPGFLTKMYRMAVHPYLSQLCKEAFNTDLGDWCGFMDYLSSIWDEGKSFEDFDGGAVDRLGAKDFEPIFKNFSVRKSTLLDTTVFSDRILRSLSLLIKCSKDIVYFNSCLLLLEKLLGRKPTDLEILYAFYPFEESKQPWSGMKGGLSQVDLANRLVQMINYSEVEINHRLEAFFGGMSDVAINNFKRNSGSYHYKMMLLCPTDAVEGMKRRMFGVHPKMINLLQRGFIQQLFKICYHQVKLSAIRQNLPMHLPLGTLRLARKSLYLFNYLRYIRSRVLLSHERGLITSEEASREELSDNLRTNIRSRLEIDKEIHRDYVEGVLKIEEHFNNRKGDPDTNNLIKEQQQEKLMKETAARILNLNVDRITEAIDAYRSKEVSPYQKIPKHVRRHLRSTNHPGAYCKYYGDLEPMKIYVQKDDMEYFRDLIYRRTLRKLAIEALDDRLSRLLFMAHNGLFTEVKPEYEEVIQSLNIPKKTADFIVFTATLRCKEYEVWRIRLNLPPYVNEFNVNPDVLKIATLDPFNLPFHISTAVYSDIKASISSSNFPYDPTPGRPSGSKNRRDMHNRMRLIKPNLSSDEDLLMNYKKNFKENEQILERSPMYYLQFRGVRNP